MNSTEEASGIAGVYFVLWTLALADPLYSVLVQSPEFFTAHRATGTSLLLAAAAISLLPPPFFSLLDIGVSRVHRPSGTALRWAIRMLMVAAIAFRVSTSLPLPGMVQLVVALLCVGIGHHFLRPGRPSKWAALALTPLVIASPLYWGTSAGVHENIAAAEPTPGMTAASEPNGTPVVFIVLDQLATTAIIDEKGGIDAERFPALADLIATSTWYRNATTVATQTRNAVPAILTGNRPRAYRAPPTLASHPANLFSLLHDHYAFNVFEQVTQLEPGRDASQSDWAIARNLLKDAAIVAGHVVLPAPLKAGLPAVDGQPAFFAGDRTPEASKEDEKGKGDPVPFYGVNRPEQVRRFLEPMSGDTSALHYIHHMNPHHPWQFFPSNTAYSTKSYVPGLPSWDRQWPTDRGAADAARQRYLLQTLGVDATLGEIVAHMREVGLFDDAMLVLVSDHGNNFTPNVQLRQATSKTYRDVIYVPLIIKYPQQRSGRVIDDNVATIDILPTIADVLGFEIPETDGESLLAAARTHREHKRVLTATAADGALQFPAEGGGEILDAGTLFEGMLFSPEDRWVRVATACDHLLGTTLDDAQELLEEDGRLALALNSDEGGYGRVGPAEFEKGWVVGRVEAGLEDEQEALVALSQAGTFVAIGRTFSSPEARHEFSLLVPEALRDPSTTLRVHVFDPAHPECGAVARRRLFARRGLDFTPEDPADSYGVGWSVFESGGEHDPDFRWALGSEATLYLDLPHRTVSLLFHAMTHGENPNQRMTVAVNGTVVGEVPVPTRTKLLGPLRVPRTVIGSGVSRIDLRFSESNRPNDRDKRRLAVRFEALDVTTVRERKPRRAAAPRD